MEFVAGQVRIRYIQPAILTILLGPTLVKSVLVTPGSSPVDISLGDNQFTTIHIEGLDAANQAGQFLAPPTWKVSDDTIVSITPSTDGLSCRVEAATPIKNGTALLVCSDTDNSSVPQLNFNITIGAEAITHLGATVDPPTEKAPPP